MVLDPLAIMLVAAASVYYALGDTTHAIALVLALVPVIGARALGMLGAGWRLVAPPSQSPLGVAR